MGKANHKEGTSSGEQKRLTITEVIPFSIVITVLGTSLLLATIYYVMIRKFVSDFSYLVIFYSIGGALWLIGTFVFFVIYAYRLNKKNAKEKMEKEKQKLYDQLKECQRCSENKINNPLAYNSFYSADDVLQKEIKLRNDNQHDQCEIYIYVADLASLKENFDVIKENVSKTFGIKYHIFYYLNSLSQEDNAAFKGIMEGQSLYKMTNTDSLDFELARGQFNFKIIIFKRASSDAYGYLAIDNVPIDAQINHLDPHKSMHTFACSENCNYDCQHNRKVAKPFYKKLYQEKLEQILDILEKFERRISDER